MDNCYIEGYQPTGFDSLQEKLSTNEGFTLENMVPMGAKTVANGRILEGKAIQLMNMYDGNPKSLLYTCGRGRCGNKYEVGTTTHYSATAASQKWSFVSANGRPRISKQGVRIGDIVNLRNTYPSTSYLITCGDEKNGCRGAYRVSTHRSPRAPKYQVGAWKIMSAGGAKSNGAYLEKGDKIHLRNMHGSANYLETCGKGRFCSHGGYYVNTHTSTNRAQNVGTWQVDLR